MAAGTRALLFVSLCVGVFVFASADQNIITAESGQTVALPCRAPNNTIILIEWSRAGLEPEYVFVWRNKKYDPDNQHPSFKDRVDLQYRQMKDGNVSLTLKNVTVNDTGTYECRVRMEESSSLEPISIINLRVAPPPGPTGGLTEDGGKEDGRRDVGLAVAAVVVVVVLVAAAAAVIGFVIYRRCTREQSDASAQPPPVEMLLLQHV